MLVGARLHALAVLVALASGMARRRRGHSAPRRPSEDTRSDDTVATLVVSDPSDHVRASASTERLSYTSDDSIVAVVPHGQPDGGICPDGSPVHNERAPHVASIATAQSIERSSNAQAASDDDEQMFRSWTCVGDEDAPLIDGSGSSSQKLDPDDEAVYEITRDAQCETPPGSDDEEGMSAPGFVVDTTVDFIDDPSMRRRQSTAAAPSQDESWGVVALPGSTPHWAGCRHYLAAGSLENASDSTIMALASQALTGKTRSGLMLTSDAVAELRAIARQIQMDLPRTSQDVFSNLRARETAALFRILFAFALLHPDVRYNQAMSALAAALLLREFPRPPSRESSAVVRGRAGPPPFREVAAYRRMAEVMAVPHMSRMYDATLSGWPAMFAAVRREFRAMARAAGRERTALVLWKHLDDVLPLELVLMDMVMTHFGRFAADDDLPDAVHRRLMESRDAYVLARAAAFVLLEHADAMLRLDGERAVGYARAIRRQRPACDPAGPVALRRPAAFPEPSVIEIARLMARRMAQKGGILGAVGSVLGIF